MIYEAFKKLPADKGAFERLIADLHAMLAKIRGEHRITRPLSEWKADAGAGLRGLRLTAVHLAVAIADAKSVRVHTQPPSEQTLSEGGFLGGDILVWTDQNERYAAATAIVEYAQLHFHRKAA